MSHTLTKIITITTVLFLFNFISSCITDYCPSPTLFYLKEVRIQAVDRTEMTGNSYDVLYTDTIRHQIAFEVQPTIELAARETIDVGFGMNKAYGCDLGYSLNPVVPTKSKMYTDKAIYWNGQEIPAQTNLLEHPEFKELISFPTFLEYEGYSLITIETEPMKFFNEPYTFTFEWVTADDIVLTDEVVIHIRM